MNLGKKKLNQNVLSVANSVTQGKSVISSGFSFLICKIDRLAKILSNYNSLCQ